MRLLSCAIFCLIIVGIPLIFYAQNLRNWLSDFTLPIRHGVFLERNILVPMRDGTQLATTVYRPFLARQACPVILIRTTYGGVDFSEIKYFVRNGYVVVTQNVRGRFGSQGTYTPHRYSRSDGFDTMDWIVRQDWSNGKIGTFGCSYLGESQVILAAAKHPNHICMIANGAGGAIGSAKGSYGYFGIYENGVLNLASALGWFTENGAIDHNIPPGPEKNRSTLIGEISGFPIVDLAKRIVSYNTGFEDVVSHELTDTWWNDEGYISEEDSFLTAGLHVNTWYDQTVYDTFRLAEHIAKKAQNRRATHQYVLIDPGNHCSAGNLPDGRAKIGEMEIDYKKLDFMKIYLDWFDYWLKDAPVSLPPRFKYFLINAASWETSTKWPPPNAKTFRYYLHEKGKLIENYSELNELNSKSKGVDSYYYDPENPVPTIGGTVCCVSSDSEISGAFDQSKLKQRRDVLVYQSEPLKSSLDLIGNAKAVIYVSTDSYDTDFTIKLVDHKLNGQEYNLQDGVVRLSFRNGIDRKELSIPGEIYKIELDFRPIAYRFKAGHRISLYISSSNFPRLARNLNTGKNNYATIEMNIATNSIHRNKVHTSYLDIPVVYCNISPIENSN